MKVRIRRSRSRQEKKCAVVVRGREETSSTNLRRSVWSINIRKGRRRRLLLLLLRKKKHRRGPEEEDGDDEELQAPLAASAGR